MYIFDVLPVPEPRMSQRDRWDASAQAGRYFAYKEELKLKANMQQFRIGKVIEVIFLIPMPESWSQKKKDLMMGKSHEQKPDTDNLLKAFCDAMTTDDSKIWSKYARKYWWNKGLIIVTRNEDFGGVFSQTLLNAAVFEDFEKRIGIPEDERYSTYMRR